MYLRLPFRYWSPFILFWAFIILLIELAVETIIGYYGWVGLQTIWAFNLPTIVKSAIELLAGLALVAILFWAFMPLIAFLSNSKNKD